MLTFGDAYLIPKIFLLALAILVDIPGIRLMHKHRNHPVFKYRTIRIYIALLFAGTTLLFLNVLESIPGLYTLYYFRIMTTVKYCIVLMVCEGYFCIGVRYYALVLTRYIQLQLMDRKACNDNTFYKRVVANIRLGRLLANEDFITRKALFTLPFWCAPVIAFFCLTPDDVFLAAMNGEQTYMIRYTWIAGGTCTIGYFISLSIFGIIIMRIFKSGKPDNFFIMPQFMFAIITLNCAAVANIMAESTDLPTRKIWLMVAHAIETSIVIGELLIPIAAIHFYGYPTDALSAFPNLEITVDSNKTNSSSLSMKDGDSVDKTKHLQESETLSTSHDTESPLTTPNLLQSFEEIMANNESKTKFAKYMRQEFQFEIFLFFDCLDFYIHKGKYRRRTITVMDRADVKLIIDEFFAKDAVNMLPLPESIREETIKEFDALNESQNIVDCELLFRPAIDNMKSQLEFHIKKIHKLL